MALLDNLGPYGWPLTLVKGEGLLLTADDGREYWDFYGGHAVSLLGHGHPGWVQALATQAATLDFVTTVAECPVRTRAAERLAQFTGLDRVFFVNSGAEANEAALKLARKVSGKPVLLAMEHGFHGRTMGALGATWAKRDQHAPAHGPTRFVPFGDLAAVEAELARGDVGGVVAEPFQGIAGVLEPPADYWPGLTELCRAHGAVLVADEVQSGMGRAGEPLLSHALGGRPDVVSVGKSLGNGFPVAACLLTEAVAATVKPGEHGTTFGGGPLACAAVLATLDAIESEHLLAEARASEARLRAALEGLPGVVAIRGRGVWLGVALDRPVAPIVSALRGADVQGRGVLVGTSARPDTLRLAPPARTSDEAIDALASALTPLLEASP